METQATWRFYFLSGRYSRLKIKIFPLVLKYMIEIIKLKSFHIARISLLIFTYYVPGKLYILQVFLYSLQCKFFFHRHPHQNFSQNLLILEMAELTELPAMWFQVKIYLRRTWLKIYPMIPCKWLSFTTRRNPMYLCRIIMFDNNKSTEKHTLMCYIRILASLWMRKLF